MPLVVLTPLLIVPLVQGTEVESQPTFTVAIQGKLSQAEDPETTVVLEAYALAYSTGVKGQGNAFDHPIVSLLGAFFNVVSAENLESALPTLKGFVVFSLDPALLRTPVSITADGSTGEIVFVFGPIAAGKLMGQTFTFTGTGIVKIVRICLTRECQ